MKHCATRKTTPPSSSGNAFMARHALRPAHLLERATPCRTRYTTVVLLEGEHGPRRVAARGDRAGEPPRRVCHADRLRPRRLARAGGAGAAPPPAAVVVASLAATDLAMNWSSASRGLARRGSARARHRDPAEAQLHRGRRVKKGQSLYSLDPAPFQAAFDAPTPTSPPPRPSWRRPGARGRA